MRKLLLTLTLAFAAQGVSAIEGLRDNIIARDYRQHLGALFEHFQRNPELSHMEFETAKRLATVIARLELLKK